MALAGRAGRIAALGCRAACRGGLPGAAAGLEASSGAGLPAVVKQQIRGMAGGHHGPSVTYAGLTLHEASSWHKLGAEFTCGLMWFWILYRFYNDFDTFVYGHAAHFEHELHHEKLHGHAGHGQEQHGGHGQVKTGADSEDSEGAEDND